jgi:hypothetical protein
MNVDIDTRQLVRFLDDCAQRQYPYAAMQSLNDVALLFQYRQREHMHGIFTNRRRDWIDRSVKITAFAKKGSLIATVAIESPGGGNRSDILAKFESQTSKQPRDGRSLFVPVDARRNAAGIIPDSARPKAFHFKEIGGSHLANATKGMTRHLAGGVLRGALRVYQGEKGTVMIRDNTGHGVILQRTRRGKKHEGLRLLFRLTPRAKLTPNLEFMAHATLAAKSFPDFFAVRFRDAQATAR